MTVTVTVKVKVRDLRRRKTWVEGNSMVCQSGGASSLLPVDMV